VLEGRHGFLKCFSYKGSPEDPRPEGVFDSSVILKDFGKKWEMADNSIKLHSCCRFSNNYCDCAIDIHNQEGFDIDQVESIHADCNNFAIYNLCNPEEVKRHPKDTFVAQFSVAYEIAIGLMRGSVLPESFTEEMLKDPKVWELCEKCTWSLDEQFEAVYPKHYPARVTVTLKNGKKFVGEVAYPKGDPEYPASKEEVETKFFANAGNTVSADKAKRIVELVDKFEELPNLDELVSCLF
jgi:2-methylcitrate dehydratase PrpD